MQITFTLRKDELNMDFLSGLKKMFSDKVNFFSLESL